MGREYHNPFADERGRSVETSLFATLGGEYRFAERLGLSGGLGLEHRWSRSPFFDHNATGLMPDLGLHYYF